MTQPLLPKAKGRGRVLALEVMVPTPPSGTSSARTRSTRSTRRCRSGKKYGMQTMNQALYQLYVARDVTEDECLRVSGDPNEFLRMIGQRPMEEQDIPAVGEKQLRAAGATRR